VHTLHHSRTGNGVHRNAARLASAMGLGVTGVANTTEVIKGVDGNDIILFISTPTAAGLGPFPCMVHFHGGGMAMLTASASDKHYTY